MVVIRAEKVIAAWPKVGQAAVQDALTFAPEELRAKLLDPVSCLKPVHAWPQEPHKSRVRATDDEWNKDVGAAYERGLMVADELDEGFKDQKGRPVLNGAGAVKKEKKVDGKVVSAQRFISNLIPSNMFQDRLEGDGKLLPYLGQLTLLQQEEEEFGWGIQRISRAASTSSAYPLTGTSSWHLRSLRMQRCWGGGRKDGVPCNGCFTHGLGQQCGSGSESSKRPRFLKGRRLPRPSFCLLTKT